ncbi:YbjN domain-containing protein [Thiorhodovibrio frisius]|uniref:Gamma-glutamyltransferase n=1 Tax=Thiorhodovibrio frisius TaxID=631362 RepID=H8YWR1_9GAMM|nr:YbjN domain-containing protein [Thiorhodovibrio frisius]EIC22887.1 gamma-glutamyltransferase [Thiorhodovibrio frisius]WPL22855.1 hypothetical protein Thiofri_03030 [Thiorhodovibrio frisius]
MATSLQEISAFLEEKNIKHELKEDEGFIGFVFNTSRYRNTEGDTRITIIIAPEEEGEFLKVFAPKIYAYKDGPHALAVYQLCLMINWRTKMLQLEYDASDGEIRAMIDFPLEDAKLTSRQLHRAIHGLLEIIETFAPAFEAAINEGRIELPEPPDQAVSDQLRALVEAVGRGGVDAETLQAIVEEVRQRGGGGEVGPDRL